MSTNPDLKESIRQEWLAAATFWKKWYPKFIIQTRAATDLVIQGASLAPGMHVLDLASGSGEPALTLAETVTPQGRVVATDLIPEMLQAAKEHAAARGLSNIEFQVADAEHLPFPAGHFDRVTCRFGIMFFPDVQKSLREIHRVLKPNGRISFVTWGTMQENPLFGTMIRPFSKYVNTPPPPPDSPDIFRFADANKLAETLTAAGFQHVHAAKHKVNWPWPGTPEEAWLSTSELAAPFKKMIAATPGDKREEAIQEVIEGIRQFSDGHSINFPATLIAAIATI
jgi:SAM-dependent methyltransferase